MAPVKAVAVLTISSNVYSIISFMQDGSSPASVEGEIKGFNPGKHGFHVHALGDTTNGCMSSGVAKVSFQDVQIPLNGMDYIVGRALVVHGDQANYLGKSSL